MKRNIFLATMLVIIGLSTKAQSWQWAKGATNSLDNEGTCITSDVNGNVYAAGYFSDATLDFGGITLTNTSGSNNYLNIFVAKYSPTGNVVWAKNAGGIDGNCKVYSICKGKNGTTYVTGDFYSSTLVFDIVTLNNPNTVEKIFVVKYDSLGNVMWAKSPTGTYSGAGYGIIVDTSGSAFVTGTYAASITFGLSNLTSAGGTDIFIAKYSTNGMAIWGVSQGSTGNESGNSISIDGAQNIYVTGNFNSNTMVLGSTTLTNDMTNSTNDIFVEKLLGSSGVVQWAKSGRGDNDDEGKGISTDPLGNSFVTGFFNSDSLMFGTYVLHNYSAGSNCFYIVKYDNLGNPQWAQRAGTANYDTKGFGVKADGAGNAYVTGVYQGNPTVSFGGYTLTDSSSGSGNIFVVKYNAAGTITWAMNAGGTAGDGGAGISSDVIGTSQYVTGYYNSNPINFGSNQLTNPGGAASVFVAKLGITVGLETIEKGNNKVSIYPNSNNGIFTLTYHLSDSNSLFQIEDSMGRVLVQKKIDATDGHQTIDATNFANGIYFWEVISGNASIGKGKVEIVK